MGRADTYGDFACTTNASSAAIIKYIGSGGNATIPDAIFGKPVTSIADMAFAGSTSLTAITIPASVTSIGDAVFNGCSSLAAITVATSNTVYASTDGVLFTKSQTMLLKYPEGRVGSYRLPETVFNIQDSAFSGCRGLTAITVDPLNLAFASIDGALLSKSLTLLFVCPAGKTGSYSITNKVTYILNSAFSGCRGLTNITIPDSITTITSKAFLDCTGLTSVTIPQGLILMNDSAFNGCTRLTSLYFEGNAPQYSGLDPLFDIGSQGTVYYREGTTGWSTRFCGWQTALWFDAEVHDFTYLQNGSTVTMTGYTGAGGDVAIPATIFGETVTVIGDSVFSGHTNLTSIIIPHTVTQIGPSAFVGCSGLTNITIPHTVTQIGPSAFAGCSGLTDITIPYTVTSIGELAFADCPGLTNVFFEGRLPARPGPGQLFENSQNVTVFYHPGIAGLNTTFEGRPTKPWTDPAAADFTFQQVGSAFFITCYKGSNGNVVIPDTIYGMPVTSMGDRTFQWFLYGNKLANVTVSFNVTNIGSFAFSGCTNLSNVRILGNINTIGSSAFIGCRRLQGVYFAGDAPAAFDEAYMFFYATNVTVYYRPGTKGWGPTFAGRPTAPWIDPGARDFSYLQNGLEMTLTGYIGSGGTIDIPDTIFARPVTSIGDSGFSYADDLTRVTIPDSVKKVGYASFYSCTGLTSVIIGNGVTNIGHLAFAECPRLTNVTIGSSVTKIGDSAFRGAAILAGTIIPGNVTDIGNGAFSGCASLTGINIPNSVTNLGGGVFEGCASLTNATLPDSITEIADAAFANCLGLKNIAIPNSVTHIGNAAFASCSSLTSVRIPARVASLGFGVFANCADLMSVFFEGNAPAMSSSYDLFENATNATVYYRAGTTGWSASFGGRPTALWSPTFQEWTRIVGLLDKFPSASAESDDPDHDGMSNLPEMLAGTDPTNPNSVLQLENTPRPDDLVDGDKTATGPDHHALYFQTVPGKSYEIQRVSALGETWQTETNVAATTRQKRVLVSNPINRSFYRVSCIP